MKNLVVYYSSKGNTEVVAKEISKFIDGDLRKIETVGEAKSLKFLRQAISALIGMKIKLKPFDFSVKEYDNVFIGGQVWAGHSTPPINSFLHNSDFTNKNVFIFLTQADGKENSLVLKSIINRVEEHGGKVADTFFIQTEMNNIIEPENVKQPVLNWLHKNNLI